MLDSEKILAELTKTKDQVKYLLERYPPSRNNDFYLQILYLRIFGKLPLPWLDWEKITDFSGKLESIRRVRAKIQNEDGLFLPTDPRILEKRQKRAKAYRKVITKI